MTLSFLRPAIVAALAVASLASCGGKATFEIAGTVSGLQYPGLVLNETFSGQTLTLTDVSKDPATFQFANTIEYGTEYNVIIAPTGQPPHQTCTALGGTTGSAGQRASINMAISCVMTPHAVGGAITLAAGTTGSFVGLKLINGSNELTPITIAEGTTAYAFTGITFSTPYGITIFAQPAGLNCKLVPKVPHPNATDVKVSGTMGDADVIIDIVCAKA